MDRGMRHVHLLLVSSLVGCSSGVIGGEGGGGGPKDQAAPRVVLSAPARGTMTQDARVRVTGTVSDEGSGVAELTVNGAPAEVAADGSFAVDVDLPVGVTVVETVARDRAGNVGKDVRAVLAGPLAPVEQSVSDALAARLGPGAFTVVGQVLGNLVSNMDLTAPVAAGNPVVDMGGSCLGAKVNVESIAKGPVSVSLVPEAGRVGVGVAIVNLDVRLRASYKVACIGGSSNIRITANVTQLTGKLALGASGGKLTSAAENVDLQFQGFNVDVSGLPGVIVDLLQDTVNDAVADKVRDAVRDAVPPLVADLLTEFDGAELTLGALGKDMVVSVRPQTVAIDAAGLFAVIEGGVAVSGGTGAEYLSTPAPADAALMAGMNGLGVGVADDLVNQLLAGLWAGGALEQNLALGPDSPATLFFGPDVAGVELSLSLPPTLSVAPGGELRVVIGDAMVNVVDAAGAPLAELAVTIDVGFTVAVTPDGRLTLALGTPTVRTQILAQSDSLPVVLTEETVAAMVELLSGQLVESATQGLGSLPIPAIGDAMVTNAQVATESGFLVLRGDLVAVP
jgi:hypothetical protein